MKKLRSLRIFLYSPRWLVVLAVLTTRCAAEIRAHQRFHKEIGGLRAAVGADGSASLHRSSPEVVGSSHSPFCQALCKKSDVEKQGLTRCKELLEKDCRSMQYYAKGLYGEKRLCLWQPRWGCSEDWTTACISELPCNSSGPELPALSACEALCFKTDVKSFDSSCASLSQPECDSGQFYETDANGTRKMCSFRSPGVCDTSHQESCEASGKSCPTSTSAGESPLDEVSNSSVALCRSLCYKTNVAVTSLSCRSLSLSHCASSQFFETDDAGLRRPCVPRKGRCEMDSVNFCPAWQPLCVDTFHGQKVPILQTASASASGSKKGSTVTSRTETTTMSTHTSPKPHPSSVSRPTSTNQPTEMQVGAASDDSPPPFCFTLCQKTDVRSVNSSCAALSLTSCASEQFFETDGDGKRRVCRRQADHCEVDRSEVCDEWWPLCEISHHSEAVVKLHYESDTPAPSPVSGCFLYCDKINTRSRNQSCHELTHAECHSEVFYETDHEGSRRMCQLVSSGCAGNAKTLCEAWQPICDVTVHAHVHAPARPPVAPSDSRLVRSSQKASASSPETTSMAPSKGELASMSPAAKASMAPPPPASMAPPATDGAAIVRALHGEATSKALAGSVAALLVALS
ncbi:unnamed protein product [Symbiodinium sp. CCMP2592]|nr:unnamed protein product [Symbiodinium sp. CCMP2592]